MVDIHVVARIRGDRRNGHLAKVLKRPPTGITPARWTPLPQQFREALRHKRATPIRRAMHTRPIPSVLFAVASSWQKKRAKQTANCGETSQGDAGSAPFTGSK
ncbi:hypothetical protein [Breoghania sp. L-A4]|uniref:hypothetical protein n=1 Tax=Breoghania sp. L-A4 TaxID=2304600 RepID=UPI0013C32C38|nr:hypothetical protein [Breoghania sp. L-A4]